MVGATKVATRQSIDDHIINSKAGVAEMVGLDPNADVFHPQSNAGGWHWSSEPATRQSSLKRINTYIRNSKAGRTRMVGLDANADVFYLQSNTDAWHWSC